LSLRHPNDTEIEAVRSLFDGKQAKKIAHKNAVLRVSPRRKALHDRGFKAQLQQAKNESKCNKS
jgi:hypothetical protein